MREPKKHYLDFMLIELQDLQEDIEFMIEEGKRRLDENQITERVFLENTTLFKNELLGIQEFRDVLLSVEPYAYETVDDIIDFLKQKFKRIMKTNGLAEAVFVCIERKLLKVGKYIKQE